MKLFAVLFATVALACMASAGGKGHGSHSSECNGIAELVGPLLELLQPLLTCFNSGLQAGAKDVGCATSDLGATLNDALQSVGSMTTGAVKGAAGTIDALPATLYKTTQCIK